MNYFLFIHEIITFSLKVTFCSLLFRLTGLILNWDEVTISCFSFLFTSNFQLLGKKIYLHSQTTYRNITSYTQNNLSAEKLKSYICVWWKRLIYASRWRDFHLGRLDWWRWQWLRTGIIWRSLYFTSGNWCELLAGTSAGAVNWSLSMWLGLPHNIEIFLRGNSRLQQTVHPWICKKCIFFFTQCRVTLFITNR